MPVSRLFSSEVTCLPEPSRASRPDRDRAPDGRETTNGPPRYRGEPS